MQKWLKLEKDSPFQLSAEEWGWEVSGYMLPPIFTDIAAASETC